MTYQISGTFIEACDCYVVCPCWVADDPDEGHCTGLFAWSLHRRDELPANRAAPTIDGLDVAGRTVVAVTTHTGGSRREANSYTVLYVDGGASGAEFTALVAAFSGKKGGPLAALAAVSGTVLGAEKARITIDPRGDSWSVRVDPATGAGPAHVVATGTPSRPDTGSAALPLELVGTALDTELGIGADGGDRTVRAQHGDKLVLRATGLPGGYLDLTGRSGMRGEFSYRG